MRTKFTVMGGHFTGLSFLSRMNFFHKNAEKTEMLQFLPKMVNNLTFLHFDNELCIELNANDEKITN